MTIKEYITSKFNSLQIAETFYADMLIESGLSADAEYDSTNQQSVGLAIISMIEEIALMPKLSSISEGGMSMSWNYADLGKYYLYLCRKWGVNANKDIVADMGVSSIIDKSNIW